MHLHRLMALAGAVIGIIGLFFSALVTDGKHVLARLAEQNDSFPDGISTIWGGLAMWAKVVVVIMIIITVAVAVMPDRRVSYDRTGAAITAVVGLALFAYSVVKYLDTGDKADNLEAGFAQAAAAGVPGVQAWEAAPSGGFFILMIGTILVIFAGVLSMVATDQ